MTKTRFYDWHAMVVEADPDFNEENRRNVEYEFTSRGVVGNDEQHERGMRVFKGDYQKRGIFAPIDAEEGALTWNGGFIRWGGYQLVWN